MVEESDVWVTVLSLTRKTAANRRKSIDPPSTNTPNPWKDCNKHTAVWNLLSIAVSHKDLQLRKAYIERIMTLSPTTQRLLMSMIENRKKLNGKNRTPSKSANKRTEEFTPGRKDPAPTKSANRTTDEKKSTSKRNSASLMGPKDDKYMHLEKRDETVNDTQKERDHLWQSQKNVSGNSLSSPNMSKRFSSGKEPPESPDVSRRNFHDAFGSPLQQPAAKRMPPPSSERHRMGQNASRNIFSPGLGDTKEYESQVQGLRDENEELALELKKSRSNEEQYSMKIDDLDEHFRKEILKVEREAREREDKAIQEYQTQISLIQDQLVQLTKENSAICSERDELLKVKDDMEVMSHNNALLDETTERLRTYKEKVQQFTDVKDALQREEEAHSRSVEENLRLKNELKNLQPLKRQLEEYKTRAVDLEVRLTDSQDELSKLKEHRAASSEVSTHMEQYVIAQEAEIKELVRRVQQNDVANTNGSSVGDGISELNPELKREILSLRNENEQLRAFAAKREEDEVSKLEQNAEDKTMLAERYKAQFLSTKDKLESTEISLADSKNREKKLQEEVNDTAKLAERYKSQFFSTKAQLESTQLSLQDSKSRESSLRTEVADSLLKMKGTQLEVEEVSKQFSKCTEDLKESIDRESNLEKELASWTSEAKQIQERSNDLSRKLSVTTQDLENSTKNEQTLSEDKAGLKIEIHSLQERCNGLTDEIQRCTIELELSHCRESKLEISVKEWMKRVQESDKHIERISASLVEYTEELKESKETVVGLETNLSESSALHMEAEKRIEKIVNELNETKSSLEKSKKTLNQNMQRYIDLQNSLTDMTCRAEDAEKISMTRMELVQSTREKLQEAEQEIETLVKEKIDLTSSVEDWTSQTEKARTVNKNLENTLETTLDSMEDTVDKLAEAQSRIEILSKERDVLTASVEKWTSKTDETKSLAKKLQRELDETICCLKNTEEKLSQSQVQNEHRTSEIEIITIGNQNLKKEISHGERSITDLRNELIKTNESLKDAERSIENLQNDLLDAQQEFDSSQQNTQRMEGREELLNKQLKEAEQSIQSLQKELLETKQNLELTQNTANEMEERERVLNEQHHHAEQMLADLEDSIEREIQTSEDFSTALEKSEADKSKMKADFDSREETLIQSLESEKGKGNMVKQELSEVKNTVNTLQDSLSSSQHREKMLKHEVTKLEDKKRECENELSELKSRIDEELENSSKSLESVREKMSAKARKQLEELQRDMTQVLEDERRTKRQQDILYKEQLTQLKQEYDKELSRLQESSSIEVEKYVGEKEKELKQLKEEHEEKMKSMESGAKEEKEKLMQTGKGMMKEIKEKKDKEINDLSDDVTFLEQRIIEEEDEKKRLGQQFQTKIIEYKKKLQLASGRINTLSADNNDFDDRVKYLEREKFKLREENDRYRRQLGGRSGSDSALQSQLETLQNEFKSAVDENRELKRKLQERDFRSLSSIGEESSSRTYTRSRANQSTMLQLRAEYEETIEALNDEKRELIMKNSASITDVQKAEKRAWLVEQDNSILKQDLTSLRLTKERLENALSSIRQKNSSVEHASFDENFSVSEDSGIPKPPTPEVSAQFEDGSSIRMASYESQRRRSRDFSILGTNQGFTNRSSSQTNYGLTSPDQDTKRFVQSTKSTAHSIP